jgi:hypothetical protein
MLPSKNIPEHPNKGPKRRLRTTSKKSDQDIAGFEITINAGVVHPLDSAQDLTNQILDRCHDGLIIASKYAPT